MAELPAQAHYDVAIDWQADGDFTDALDNVTPRVLADPGISSEYGRDTARSTAPPMIGVTDFVLDNRDRMLSPENAASPAYQFLLPGRPVRVRALHGTRTRYREHRLYRDTIPYRGRADYGFISGQVESLEQHPEYGQMVVSVSALSTMARLQRQVVSVPLWGVTRTDTAVGYVLDAAGWPSSQYSLAVSDSTLRQFWVDERPAWDVLLQLVRTEGPGSVLYQDGYGTLIWKNRNHRATDPRSLTVQARLTDGTVPAAAGDLPYQQLTYSPQWADIITRATITVKARELAAAPEVIWELGASMAPPIGTVVVWARPDDPFLSAIAPVAGTDYTVAGGTATVALEWTNGAVAKLNVTGLTGSPVVSDLQLRAYPFRVVGETTVETKAPAGDPTLEKTLTIDAWPELDPNHARSICDSYVSRYMRSVPIITATVTATDAAMLRRVLDLQISDRLSVVNRHLGLAGTEMFIEKIAHRITRGGAHTVILSLEPAAAIGAVGAVWDIARWDAPTSVWGV